MFGCISIKGNARSRNATRVALTVRGPSLRPLPPAEAGARPCFWKPQLYIEPEASTEMLGVVVFPAALVLGYSAEVFSFWRIIRFWELVGQGGSFSLGISGWRQTFRSEWDTSNVPKDTWRGGQEASASQLTMDFFSFLFFYARNGSQVLQT